MEYIKNRIKAAKNNYTGFTLVEVVVAFAILGTVALCVSIMMNAGTNMFVKVNKNVNLSTKTQMVMVQLREFLIDSFVLAREEDANGNFVILIDGYDDDFVTYNTSGQKTYNGNVVFAVGFNAENKEIRFAEFKATNFESKFFSLNDGKITAKSVYSDFINEMTGLNPGNTRDNPVYGDDAQPFSTSIKDFTAEFADVVNQADGDHAGSIVLNVTSEFSNTVYSKEQVVCLRDNPVAIKEAEEGSSIAAGFMEAVKTVIAKYDGGAV